jgi:CheY-like chemotaxis protein
MNNVNNTSPTVMVVDDSEDIRELVWLHLTQLGYRAIEAANGREAVDIVSTERPSLILMDITMPVLDGLEATRLIRGMAELCGVVIIAFTALQGVDCRESALAAGCDDFLQKPVNLGQLANIIDRHLHRAI